MSSGERQPKLCSVEGCEKSGQLTRGWCQMHYQRWRQHGNLRESDGPRRRLSERKPSLSRDPLVCDMCGAGFIPQNVQHRFCSQRCRSRGQVRRERINGTYAEHLREKREQIAAARLLRPKHSCDFCGVYFIAVRPDQHCCGSTECQRLHNNANQKKMNDTWRDKYGHARSREYEKSYECKHCGNKYQSSNGSRTSYCSIACNNRARLGSRCASPRFSVSRSLRKVERAAKGTKGSRPFAFGPCQRCGTLFMARYALSLPKYCSPRCATAASRQRHVAQTPHFERDKSRRQTRNRLKREQRQEESWTLSG